MIDTDGAATSESGLRAAPAAGGAGHWDALKILGVVAVGAWLWWHNHTFMGGPTVRHMLDIETMVGAGQYDTAIAATSRMIDQTPTWEWPHTMRGETYRRMGKLDLAFADLGEAIRLNPGSVDARYDRCLAFHDKGDIDRALADCEEAARLKPDWNSYEAIAAMLLARGDVDRAYARLGQFDGLTPRIELPAPLFYRGQIALFLRGDVDAAVDDLARASRYALSSYGLDLELGAVMPPAPPGRNTIPLAFTFNPDGLYLLVWTHIARVRARQDDARELAAGLEKLSAPLWNKVLAENLMAKNIDAEAERRALAPWPAPIFALALRKSTPETVRAAAQAATDPAVRARRLCDVDFYLGEYALANGARDAARTLLRAAVAGCPAAAREASFARAELARLAP